VSCEDPDLIAELLSRERQRNTRRSRLFWDGLVALVVAVALIAFIVAGRAIAQLVAWWRH